MFLNLAESKGKVSLIFLRRTTPSLAASAANSN